MRTEHEPFKFKDAAVIAGIMLEEFDNRIRSLGVVGFIEESEESRFKSKYRQSIQVQLDNGDNGLYDLRMSQNTYSTDLDRLEDIAMIYTFDLNYNNSWGDEPHPTGLAVADDNPHSAYQSQRRFDLGAPLPKSIPKDVIISPQTIRAISETLDLDAESINVSKLPEVRIAFTLALEQYMGTFMGQYTDFKRFLELVQSSDITNEYLIYKVFMARLGTLSISIENTPDEELRADLALLKQLPSDNYDNQQIISIARSIDGALSGIDLSDDNDQNDLIALFTSKIIPKLKEQYLIEDFTSPVEMNLSGDDLFDLYNEPLDDDDLDDPGFDIDDLPKLK